jgi:hypothetical protein
MRNDLVGRRRLVKIRHALSFALIGWFLMVTPLTQDWPWHPTGAPLQQWYTRNIAFPSKQKCEADKQRVIMQQRNASPMNDTWSLKIYYGMLLQCVPADDPRMQQH